MHRHRPRRAAEAGSSRPRAERAAAGSVQERVAQCLQLLATGRLAAVLEVLLKRTQAHGLEDRGDPLNANNLITFPRCQGMSWYT